MSLILQADGRPQPRIQVETAIYLTKESLDWLNAFDPLPERIPHGPVIRHFWRQKLNVCQKCGRAENGERPYQEEMMNWQCDCPATSTQSPLILT